VERPSRLQSRLSSRLFGQVVDPESKTDAAKNGGMAALERRSTPIA